MISKDFKIEHFDYDNLGTWQSQDETISFWCLGHHNYYRWRYYIRKTTDAGKITDASTYQEVEKQLRKIIHDI